MTKKEFIKLINNAKVDENGNLYYIDNSLGIGCRGITYNQNLKNNETNVENN